MKTAPWIALIAATLLFHPCTGLSKDKAAKAKEKKSKSETEWITLYDGKSFDGWKINENEQTWKIVEGALVCKGNRSHLFYDGKEKPFKNFEFSADVLTKPGSNAGIYFHTKFQQTGWPAAGFEAQVNNTHKDPKKTASLYAVKNVLKAPAKDNEWFTMNIKVNGKKITISVDGKVITEYVEPDDAKPQSKQFARVLGSGTFALQGHDPQSEVHFKNIKVRKLPD